VEAEPPSFFDLYESQLYSLPFEGSKSLVIDFPDLYISNPDLAIKLIESPERVLRELEEEAKEKLRFRCPEYLLEVGDIHIRVRNLPETLSVRDIKSRHISRLIQVRGIVTRVSIPSPEPVRSVYKCQSCGETYVTEKDPPKSCDNCKGRKFEFVEEESEYVDTQKIRIQESPEDLPPGQIPHYVDIILRDDLVNTVNPGDYIQCTAIVHVKRRRRSNPSLEIVLEANHIETIGREGSELELTHKDEEEIRKLSRDPMIYQKIIASIAPGIKGLDTIKEAVALQLFGGVPKYREGHRIRGDIHILLVGDPGTGRSQLLKYVAGLSPRGLYTSGRGASAAGLTAALVRDESGAFNLEAGALVLMDGGICCIDEIEKMRPEDRVALHPAMEQQVVTISKGGINAELNARTSILAAANPAFGRYNYYRSLMENLHPLPVTILNRFDLIFIVKDTPEEARDREIASHILDFQMGGEIRPPIPAKLLRKYIAYAKRINPKLTPEVKKAIVEFYTAMRKRAKEVSDTIPITPRQLESLIRLAEARARLHLRDRVTIEDVEAAKKLVIASLRDLEIDVGGEGIELLTTGKPKTLREKIQEIMNVIRELSTQYMGGLIDEEVIYKNIEEKLEIKKEESERILEIMKRDGLIYSPRPRKIKII